MAGARDQSATPEVTVVHLATLLADHTRAAMLWALMDGRRLPIGDLARIAGVSASTASAHLSRLVEAQWLAVEQIGRHRYVRLANPMVAELLETLAATGGVPIAPVRAVGPTGAIRLARSCYDHLAGQAGVALTDALLGGGLLTSDGFSVQVTDAGRVRLAELDVDTDTIAAEAMRRRRQFARLCLDWSERRHHLAGALGEALLELVLARGWFERMPKTRALKLTNSGRRALQREFAVRLL
jgi:DNA-binding transcriptional ArsR family regulator